MTKEEMSMSTVTVSSTFNTSISATIAANAKVPNTVEFVGLADCKSHCVSQYW
jgi:hypothetical protein